MQEDIVKNPLYALLISPDHAMRRKIELGLISATIRQGWRKYDVGPVMLGCEKEPWVVMADIEEVRHTRIQGLDQPTKARTGFSVHPQGLLEDLRKFYPDLTLTSQVTVICWTNVRGTLVTHRRQMHGLRTD